MLIFSKVKTHQTRTDRPSYMFICESDEGQQNCDGAP